MTMPDPQRQRSPTDESLGEDDGDLTDMLGELG